MKFQIHPSIVILYDENINENVSYYEEYLKSLVLGNVYYNYPEEIIFLLDKNNVLKESILNLIINDMIEKVNNIQDRALDKKESFIQLLAEIDEIIKLLNNFFNKIKHLNQNHLDKLHNCIKNILYIKREVLADEERMYSQMQELDCQLFFVQLLIKKLSSHLL